MVPHRSSTHAERRSLDTLSFGFVATAILISMFLVMAIFERFLAPTPPLSAAINDAHTDLESQAGFAGKQTRQSPSMTVYSCGVSVLMPGNDIPTFIGRPAPVPCSPKRVGLEPPLPFPLRSPSPTRIAD